MVDGVSGNSQYIFYTIKKGDNLTKIAREFNTTVSELLKLNTNIKNPDMIYYNNILIIEDKIFNARQDYSKDRLNIGTLTVNGQEITTLGGKDLVSNYFQNNWSALHEISVNDDDPATKIVVEIQQGENLSGTRDLRPYDILNKVVMDHLDNSNTITVDTEEKKQLNTLNLKDTDLYKRFISEDVNGSNFTGENNLLAATNEQGVKVQLPSVEVDKNGNKYFTLHGKDGEIFYFDATGKEIEFSDGVISSEVSSLQVATPEIKTGNAQDPHEAAELNVRADNKDTLLNVGNIYINGENSQTENVSSNFYVIQPNQLMTETLNDNNDVSRLDIQLNLGNNIQERDTNANDILKKMLGNNFQNSSSVTEDKKGAYTLTTTPLKDTDLYKAFISEDVNGSNFNNDKLVRNESGNNLVQFPALECDTNGVKYYILHTIDGQVLYFNDRGENITPAPNE